MQLLIAVLSLDVAGLVLRRFIPVCFFFFFRNERFTFSTVNAGQWYDVIPC